MTSIHKIINLLGWLVVFGLISLPANSEMKVDQEIEVGVQQKDVNSPEAKFEEYRDIPNGVVIPHYELEAEGEDIDISIEMKDVTQEDQSANFEVRKPKLKIEASWDQTPHNYSNVAETPYQETSDGYLDLPDFVRENIQNSTDTYADYNQLMHPIDLETRTDTGEINLDYRLGEKLTANLGVSERMKKGTQALGASFTRNHVVNIAQPIDEKTYESNVGLGYGGKTVQWNFGYMFSSFQNDRETITWENPQRITDADNESSKGRLNAAPDNSAHLATLNGGINLPAKTRVTADIQYANMRQNASLLPFSINSANVPFTDSNLRSALPTDKADANVINWDQDYKVTNKALSFLTMGVRYHSFQQNNETPEYIFKGSAGLDFNDTNNASPTPTMNHAFEMRKDTLEGSLDFDVTKAFGVGASYEMAWVDRQHREVEKTKEDTLALDASYRLSTLILIRASYENARRRMDDFKTAELISIGETPGMRLYDVSDRDRQDGRISVQMMSQKTHLGLYGSAGYDKYLPGKGDLAGLADGGNPANAQTMYGLLDAHRAGTGIDLDTVMTERFSFFTFYDYHVDQARQRSNRNTSGAEIQEHEGDWEMKISNVYQTIGVGLDADFGFSMLKIGSDFTYSKASYDYVEKGTLAGSNPLDIPETKTTKQVYYVQANVPVNTRFEYGLGYVFEKYDVYDWASDQAPTVVGTTTQMYLGDSSQDYKAHIITAKAKYKF